MFNSQLTKSQIKKLNKFVGKAYIQCEVRWDDRHGNGHNTFSITGTKWVKTRKRDTEKHDLILVDGIWYEFYNGGCIHDVLSRNFPEVRELIKFHLTNSDSPMHYKDNTLYHAKQGNFEYARISAIWEDATEEQLLSSEELDKHLPIIMEEFKSKIEAFGFVW